MLGFIAAIAVATIIAVVAGLTLATSGAIAHDLYVNLIKKGNVRERDQVLAARITAIVVGIVATMLGILAEGVNVAVLVILAICIAASANFTVLALSLFWRRFNTGGVIGGMGLGLISSVGLALIGPGLSRQGRAVAAGQSDHRRSAPRSFGAVLGTLIVGRNDAHERRFDEVMFRVHTGMRSPSTSDATIREGLPHDHPGTAF